MILRFGLDIEEFGITAAPAPLQCMIAPCARFYKTRDAGGGGSKLGLWPSSLCNPAPSIEATQDKTGP